MIQVTEAIPPKDTRLNPSRLPSSDRARTLVTEVRNQLLGYEAKFCTRKRARRKADQQRFDRIVTAIVCDLVHGALTSPSAWRHVPLSKRKPALKAAGAEFMTEARIDIIRWMSAPEMDWLELRKAAQVRNPFGGQQSTIRASARLRRYMEDREIGLEDLGRDPELLGDPVILRSPKLKGKTKTLPVPEGEPAATFRSELLRLNDWLARADIVCDGHDEHGRPRDTGDRWLRRIFNNGRLDEGGRLYGGFWQSMGKDARIEDLFIGEEPVVSLDFGQCAINIAYAQQGARPPAGDLYAVPGLERHREGVKALLNALLHSPKALGRFPRGTRQWFPKRFKVEDVVERVISHHSAIRPLLHSGFGMRGFFIESQILMRCLLDLMERGIVALPIHDCLVVPLPAANIAREVMQASFREIAGALNDVEVDGTCAFLPSGSDLQGSIATTWIRSTEVLGLGGYLSDER